MAHDVADLVENPDVDYAEHVRNYRLFLRLVLYSAIGVAGILILLAFISL